jgi:KaiC/GvpD/RAD55 family RecA-like ATPase
MEIDETHALDRLHFITIMIDQAYSKMKEIQDQGVDVDKRLSQLIEILNDMQKKLLMLVKTSPQAIALGFNTYKMAIKKI